MINSLIILSDIHGNLSALEAVLRDIERHNYNPDAIALLGDNINYGMRPNEVIETIKSLQEKYRIIANIWGNHEKALIDDDTTHFSTDRGRKILAYTKSILNHNAFEYIKNISKEGFSDIKIRDRRILFIHGNIRDPYWGKININSVNDEIYAKYDYVISGHSHIPQMIDHFYACENSQYRNKKRTIFLNPGSVGQPRNHNPKAQYLYMEIESEIFHFNCVEYDVEEERSLYNNQVDEFYSERLKKGI